MNTKTFFIILFIFAGLVIFGLSKKTNTTDLQTTQNRQFIKGENSASELSQTSTMGAVSVEVTPIQLEPEKQAIFEVVLNTHSVDLNFDFTKIITLVDDQGVEYRSTNWTGDKGGHHLTGNISFEPLSKTAKTIKLSIVEIDGATSNFTWSL